MEGGTLLHIVGRERREWALRFDNSRPLVVGCLKRMSRSQPTHSDKSACPRHSICLIAGFMTALFPLASPSIAQESDDSDAGPPSEEPEISKPVQGPSDHAGLRLNVGILKPNVDLPDHVQAPEGELTLFADFEHAGEEGIPLYLVNRTGEDREMPSQDRDLLVRLEFRDSSGAWQRAQVHRDSWCGNSYYEVRIGAGQHVRWLGYWPQRNGKAAKVRYRSGMNNLVSNVGEGVYLEEDRRAASLDDLAANDLPSDWAMVLRSRPDLQFHHFPITASRFRFALELVSDYRESAYYRKLAEEFLAVIDDNDPESIQGIRRILESEWPPPGTVSLDQVAEACLESIDEGNHPEVAWTVLRSLVTLRSWDQDDDKLSNEILSRIATAMPASFNRGLEHEAHAAAEMINSGAFEKKFIKSEQLLDWIKIPEHNVVRLGTLALARRHRLEDLVAVGRELPGEGPYLVLGALASGGKFSELPTFRARQPESGNEREYWAWCFENDPVAAVKALPRKSNNLEHYKPIVLDLMRKHLKDVVSALGHRENEPADEQELSDLSSYVRFFGELEALDTF